MIKAIIADDQVLLREMLRTMLLQDSEIEVAGCAGNGNEVINLCRQHKPDIILMDIRMPDMDGIKALTAIKRSFPKVKVIMLTTFQDNENITEAYLNGADGYILKDIKPELLVLVVKCIYNELFVMCKSAHSFMMRQFGMMCRNKVSVNTKAEGDDQCIEDVELDKTDLKILKLLAEGNSNKSIAEQLNFSEGTVKNRISRVLNLLGLKDRTQLVVYALKNNLI